MDPVWIDFLKASPFMGLALVVWFQLRDARAEATADRATMVTTLRSIDIRLGKILERTRTTPALGVSSKRRRTQADSDSPDETGPVLPRTITDEDVDQ